MNKEIISKRQRNLLILSEGIRGKGLEELYSFLKANTSLHQNDVKSRSGLRNLLVYFDDLLKECQSEWKPNKTQPYTDLGAGYEKLKVTCELCGFKHLRYQHKIQNQINKRTLIIGSDCAEEFGEELNNQLIDSKIEGGKAYRRIFIEERFPGIRSFSDSLYKYTKSQEIIISKELENNWLLFCSKFTNEYKKCLGNQSRSFEVLRGMWKEKKELQKEIRIFVDENKNKEYIATKEIYKWLQNTENKHVIKMIQENNGLINQLTLHRILEPNLVSKVLLKLKPYFMKEKIELIGYSPSKFTVSLKIGFPLLEVNASLKYSELIQEYSELAFDMEVDWLDQKKILLISSFDNKSERELIERIFTSTKKYAEINILKSDDKIFIRENSSYKQINYTKFLFEVKLFVLSKSIEQMELENIIVKTTEKVLTRKEYKRYKEISEEAAKLSI